ncbi:MFS transporter [Streptomyces sp. SID3343]|uniref:CynX/NimT family MFS transporter n=1 Tax=Streptomyces sp. SID3343 TaxID=2690260 RepID=UPI0013710BE6|nr:MFS transporter [Streptomyces sp. SID3343]MYV96851.1 MFS transporter [Streptomyces sp. SID3343]
MSTTNVRISSSTTAKTTGGALLLAGIVLIALNMRAGLSSVSPLVGELRDVFHLSATTGSLITAIPVLFLGLISPLAPIAARRFGTEAVLLGALVVVGVGILLRVVPNLGALFAGGALVGAGIAVLNVLMPGVVKREFPDRAATMIGVYSAAMVFGAAVSAGATVPLENAIGHGWQPAIGFWAVLAFAAVAVWLPHVRRRRGTVAAAMPHVPGLWKSRLAWLVTGFMGLQSLLFYVLLAWMPTILTDNGISKGTAAAIFAFNTFVQIPASLAGSVIAGRMRNQSWLVVGSIGLVATGYVGLMVAPAGGAWLWAVVLGLGQGGAVSLALTLIVLRSPDPNTAAQLSGMAQAVGYVFAAFGPLAAGALHQVTDGWTVPIVLMLVLCVCALACGIGASRPEHVRVGRVGE